MTINNPVPGKQRDIYEKAGVGALSLTLGVAFGALGGLLAVWIVVALFSADLASYWVIWTVENVPLSWTMTGRELADQMLQGKGLLGTTFAAFVLCWIAMGSLRKVRQVFGPPGLSDDAWGRLELESAPQVGVPLKGRIVLTKPGAPGEVFKLSLTCIRRPWATSDGKTTLLDREQNVEVDPEGRILPVDFEIPDTAFASERRENEYVVEWSFKAYATTGIVAFPSEFELEVAPQLPSEVFAQEAAESPLVKAEINAIERDLEVVGRSLLPPERAELREMTPEQRAQARVVLEKTGKLISNASRYTLGCMLVFVIIVATVVVAGNLYLSMK